MGWDGVEKNGLDDVCGIWGRALGKDARVRLWTLRLWWVYRMVYRGMTEWGDLWVVDYLSSELVREQTIVLVYLNLAKIRY
jgi:hypothetical protein